MAKTPRKWTGARSPSGLKRVRSSARRHEILQPRRSAAKTLVKAAIEAVGSGNGTTAAGAAETNDTEALAAAMSALDRAAKVGAIHPNAAARRKSRLVRKVNAMVGGVATAPGATAKTVSRAQAQKAAKARIAAGKADKAKGAQTAAGKARAALTRTSRSESADGGAGASSSATARPAVAAAKTAPKGAAVRTAAKAPARAAAKATPRAKAATTAKAAAPAKAVKAPASTADKAKASTRKSAKA